MYDGVFDELFWFVLGDFVFLVYIDDGGVVVRVFVWFGLFVGGVDCFVFE